MNEQIRDDQCVRVCVCMYEIETLVEGHF
jgi:hypothetical protein